MDDISHVKLILEVIRKTKTEVTFKIVQQTLRGDDFNASTPAGLRGFWDDVLNPDDYPEDNCDDTLEFIDVVSSDSISVSPYMFYVQGDDDEFDEEPLTVYLSRWRRIVKSVLFYNQLYNRNNLTMKDVIWTPTTSR